MDGVKRIDDGLKIKRTKFKNFPHTLRVRNQDIDYHGRVNNPKRRAPQKKKTVRENEEVVLEPLPNVPDRLIEQLTVSNISAYEKKRNNDGNSLVNKSMLGLILHWR